MSIASRIDQAERIAREAGELALAHFMRQDALEVERKGLQDRVSQADREVEALIRARLLAHFPSDGFVGEESGSNARDVTQRYLWVVDPIDGTDCFVNGIRAWCISIALVVDGKVDSGVIFDANANEMYRAVAGHGATLNGTPIGVCHAADLRDGITGIGFSHRVPAAPTLAIVSALLEAGGMFQRNGSGALMLAYVAAGRYLGYYEAHINAWDVLAGLALVREAGGVTNDFLAGGGLANGNPVLASAPGVADTLAGICGLEYTPRAPTE